MSIQVNNIQKRFGDFVALDKVSLDFPTDHPATPFVFGFLGSVNLFHGRVDGDQLAFGEHRLQHPAGDLAHGAEVLAFARPHELRIVADQNDNNGNGAGIAARVERVLSFGASARVELTGVVPAASEAELRHYEVEVARSELGELDLSEGQIVRLVPSQLRVFERPLN